MELLKETKVWRVSTEDQAVNMIQEYKDNAAGYTITKGGYVIKTKKSKGEIVDSWCIVTIEFSYEL
jgi:hypothetical protein